MRKFSQLIKNNTTDVLTRDRRHHHRPHHAPLPWPRSNTLPFTADCFPTVTSFSSFSSLRSSNIPTPTLGCPAPIGTAQHRRAMVDLETTATPSINRLPKTWAVTSNRVRWREPRVRHRKNPAPIHRHSRTRPIGPWQNGQRGRK
jgi:hypothetical protein